MSKQKQENHERIFFLVLDPQHIEAILATDRPELSQ